jgi:hypothetical protein
MASIHREKKIRITDQSRCRGDVMQMAVLHVGRSHVELDFVAVCLEGEPLNAFVLISNCFLKIDFDSKMGKVERDIYKNCSGYNDNLPCGKTTRPLILYTLLSFVFWHVGKTCSGHRGFGVNTTRHKK